MSATTTIATTDRPTRTLKVVGGVAFAIAASVPMFSGSGAGAAEHQCQGRTATHVGTDGYDYILGTSGDDVIVAYGGDDFIVAGAGDDFVCAGEGDDDVFLESGDDRAYGEGGSDTILGYSGNDLIVGGDDNDHLYGNTDSDSLIGGPGFDTLDGGTGGSGIGDWCVDTSGAVIGANFTNCEFYDTYLFTGRIDKMPGLTIGGG